MTFDEFIKKGIDNLRFALNLDDHIPEHIRQELTGQMGGKANRACTRSRATEFR